MTQKLEELFNLPPAEETTAESAKSTIEENRAIIQEVDSAIDKIDAALPYVNDLDTSDKELDDLSDLAKEKFQEVQQVSPVDSEYYKKATDRLKDDLE